MNLYSSIYTMYFYSIVVVNPWKKSNKKHFVSLFFYLIFHVIIFNRRRKKKNLNSFCFVSYGIWAYQAEWARVQMPLLPTRNTRRLVVSWEAEGAAALQTTRVNSELVLRDEGAHELTHCPVKRACMLIRLLKSVAHVIFEMNMNNI